jgi:putative redox protein
MDEPSVLMGKTLILSTLLASLAACTLSTLRMYIDRGWDIPEINISLNFYQAILNSLLQFQDQFVFQQN